jgi:hypothetical protein
MATASRKSMAIFAGSSTSRSGHISSVITPHAVTAHAKRANKLRGWRDAVTKVVVASGWAEFIRPDYSSVDIKML